MIIKKARNVLMYQDSRIWQTVMMDDSHNKNEKEYLRVEYQKAHDHAALLAGDINRFLPEFTVHDISHLDALWKMADIFLPENYPLNPVEVFVLGVSFLIHDLGMGLAAYPNGMVTIQNEMLWKDTVASLCKKRGLHYDFNDIDNIDYGVRQEATATTLRALHAKKADRIALDPWSVNGINIYIIDDLELRNGYGEIIGKIAASHGWPIEKVKEELSPTQGTISKLPAEWNIDPFKLACIIRIADAINIDDSRAPMLLQAVRSLGQYSQLHWIFQSKLSQPQVIDNRIAFSSKTAFTIADRDAWWLCYDTLKWVDKEIRSVDSALIQSGHMPFGCVGIHSIDNIQDLIKRIKVTGWQPIDTRIRATKVAHLVKTLGGDNLYDGARLVPLRELIQNASDAIRARRYLEDESNEYGTITITLDEESGKQYLEVEDNGLGMSVDTMVNVLLDFGNSFWATDKPHFEFPGLEQTPFKPTGKYGIGFFSVFMWGEHVVITSNRFDMARSDTTILEFVAGINERPFLRKANANETLKNGGTKIRIYLFDSVLRGIGSINASTLESDVEELCSSLDCNVDIIQTGKTRKHIIRANDWMTIEPSAFLVRCMSNYVAKNLEKSNPKLFEFMCKSLRLIQDENKECIGRICLNINNDEFIPRAKVNVGGLYSSALSNTDICGIMIGETNNVSRTIATPVASIAAIDAWVQEQAMLVNNSDLSNSEKMQFAKSICNITKTNTCIQLAELAGKLLSFDEIKEYVRNDDNDEYIVITLSQSEFDGFLSQYTFFPNVFLCADYDKGELFGGYKSELSGAEISHFNTEYHAVFCDFSVLHRIVDAIASGWGVELNTILKSISYDRFPSAVLIDESTFDFYGYKIKKPKA